MPCSATVIVVRNLTPPATPFGKPNPLARAPQHEWPKRIVPNFSPSAPTYAESLKNGTGMGPDDFQAVGSSWMVENPIGILGDDMGLGKLLPNSEPVLTPTGWVPMGALIVGDRVIGQNGQATRIVNVYPQGLQPIIRITFSDGTTARASWDHLWNVQTAQNDTARRPHYWRTMTTREIADIGLKDKAGNRTWRIPMCESVCYDNVTLPLDPYLLGVLLGDGYLGKTYTSIIGEREIAESLCIAGTHAVHRSWGITQFTVKDKTVRDTLVELGLTGHRAWEKFVPDMFLRSSPAQRLALLQGLMDTDGYAMPDGGAEFSSTSSSLIDGVIELTQSLGGIARGRRKAASTYTYKGEKKTGRFAERVNIKLPSPLNPFRGRKALAYVVPTKYAPTRLIESIDEDGFEEATCIEVEAEDGLFLTRSFIVTHNCKMTLDAIMHVARAGIERIETVLILCEASNIDTWLDELTKWYPAQDCIAYRGAKRRAMFAKWSAYSDMPSFRNPSFVIMSYSIFRQDAGGPALTYDWAILDEGHVIRSSPLQGESTRSQISLIIHSLKPKRRHILSGTPIITSPADWWNVGCWLGVEKRTWKQFEDDTLIVKNIAVSQWTSRRKIVSEIPAGIATMRSLISQCMLRRTKAQVLKGLPSLRKDVRIVRMLPNEINNYEAMKEMHSVAVERLANGDEPAINPEVAIMRLGQLTSSIPSKINAAMAIVTEANASSQKVLIFTKHLETLRMLYAALQKQKTKFVFIHGGVSTDAKAGEQSERGVAVHAFQGDPEVKVLIGTAQACRVGLTLTAASVVILMDEEYSPKYVQQLMDRAHRIGQLNSVLVIRLEAVIPHENSKFSRTIEHQLQRLLARRNVTADAIVQLSSFSQQEIRRALRDDG